MNNKIKIIKTAIILVVFSTMLSLNSYATIHGENIKDFDEKLINDMEIYQEINTRTFQYNDEFKSYIEDDWNVEEDETIRNIYREKADGFKYDFVTKEIFNENESLGYKGKTSNETFMDRNGYYYVSRKRYTNPYMYSYGAILIIEKWNGKPSFDNQNNLIGFTYFELKGDEVYQNGVSIFDAGDTTRNKGYITPEGSYPVVLTDIDYSVNDNNEHIITAVGLGFKENRADPNDTSNYQPDGSLRVGYTVTSIFSMKIEPIKSSNKDYYNGYKVTSNLIDGKEVYGFPYNFETYDYERTEEEKRGLFNYIYGQFLPRLTNDIHDKSVNWLITEFSQEWLTNRIGKGWGEAPYMLLMQVDTMEDNKPVFVSGYYQIYTRFYEDVEKIQTHYAYLTNEISTFPFRDDNMYSEYLQQTDGLSPYFIDKGFSHNRINTMYMIEREPNTAIGKKIKFAEQEYNLKGEKYIRPLGNKGIEIRINKDFMDTNKKYINDEYYNEMKYNNEYTNFYRNVVSESPIMAHMGAYRECDNIVPEKQLEISPILNMSNYNYFLKKYKYKLNTEKPTFK